MKNINKINLCNELNTIIKSVISIKSTSSSPTETASIIFTEGIYYDKPNEKNNIISNGFLKIFADIEQNAHLKYEIKVYDLITKSLLDYDVNPGFVRMYNYGNICTFDELVKIFKKLDSKNIRNNLIRNLKWAIAVDSKGKEIQNKPTLYNDELLPSASLYIYKHDNKYYTREFKDEILHYKYSFILTENMSKSILLSEWLHKKQEKQSIFTVLFQISTAIYALNLMKIVHNDLHYENIFIQTLDHPENIIYYINGKEYSIISKYKIFIYDFDRVYCLKLKNNPYLDDVFCNTYFQCNEFHENLDFIKIVCYLFRYEYIEEEESKEEEDVKKRLLECIIMKEKDYAKLQESYIGNENNCYFQDINKGKESREEFLKLCYDMENIVGNLFNLIKKDEKKDEKIKLNIYLCDKEYFNAKGELDIEKQTKGLEEKKREKEEEREPPNKRRRLKDGKRKSSSKKKVRRSSSKKKVKRKSSFKKKVKRSSKKK